MVRKSTAYRAVILESLDITGPAEMAALLHPLRIVYKTTSDGLEIDADVYVPAPLASTPCPVRKSYNIFKSKRDDPQPYHFQ